MRTRLKHAPHALPAREACKARHPPGGVRSLPRAPHRTCGWQAHCPRPFWLLQRWVQEAARMEGEGERGCVSSLIEHSLLMGMCVRCRHGDACRS